MAAGRYDEAARAFSAALIAAPDFADAAQNLGCSLYSLQRFDDAALAFADEVRLRPEADGFYNYGMALSAAGKPDEALGPLRSAVALDPTLSKHHEALGRALIAVGRRREAVPALVEAAFRDPSNAAICGLLATVLFDEGRLEEAVAAGAQAVKLDPGSGQAQGGLARALHALGRSAAALPPGREAVRLRPTDAGAAATLGAVLYGAGRYAEALDMSRRALRLSPGLYQAKANEALALEALGMVDDAVAAGREAVAMGRGDAETRHNLACALLASGQMTAEAWTLYEARLDLNPAARAIAAIPRWRGEDIAGKTVLLHCEQGLGDTIQFARYAALVAERGARVVLAVQPELVRLLQGTPGAAAVVDAREALPRYDVFCPLMSLPGVFGTTLETIPPICTPIATSDSVAWGLNVGLAWAGGSAFAHDAARSAGLAAMAPLADTAGATFHSLQLPVQPLAEFSLQERMADVRDFADTAGIIAGLDLVIAVDTAVAHLAASMGKEVWLLSRHMGCWRWLRDRVDSPWYPTMRIYRQERPGDWATVIDRVRCDLRRRVSGQKPLPPSPTRAPTALDDLVLPPGAPCIVLAFVGENENGSLRVGSQAFMDLLPPVGLTGHVIDLCRPGWMAELRSYIDRGVLFAWGAAGVGARISDGAGLLWESERTPFISVMADSPCIMPTNHHVASDWVANGYCYPDWFDMQRKLVRSPQLSARLPVGVVANSRRDAVRWADRPHRMVLVKTGRDPLLHRAEWESLPRRLRAVVEDTSQAALQAGVSDIAGLLLTCVEAHGLSLDGRTDMLFGLMQAVDGYVRDVRSTNMVRALLDLPADVIGRGWGHVAQPGCRARFHQATDAAALPELYANTAFLLNTMPNFSRGTHERVLSGFAARACVVTNENADMQTRFGALPSYFAVDTEAPDLGASLAAIFHSNVEPDTLPALNLVSKQHSGEGYVRALIDLALTVRATADFAPWQIRRAV